MTLYFKLFKGKLLLEVGSVFSFRKELPIKNVAQVIYSQYKHSRIHSKLTHCPSLSPSHFPLLDLFLGHTYGQSMYITHILKKILAILYIDHPLTCSFLPKNGV